MEEPGAARSRRGRLKSKRASGDYYDKRKTTCMLYLQADHLFYEKMGRSEEACIEVMTRHVQRVNSIYRAVGEKNMKNWMTVIRPGVRDDDWGCILALELHQSVESLTV